MSIAIPKHLLIHDVVLRSYVDHLGETSFKADETVRYVRVEDTKQLNYQQGRSFDSGRKLMFVDRVNSEYLNFDDFIENSEVVFKGKTYTIESVEYLNDDTDKVHHLEVYLV